MRTFILGLVVLTSISCTSEEKSDSGRLSGSDTNEPQGDGDGGPAADECDDTPGSTICVDGSAIVCDDEGDPIVTEDCAASEAVCFDDYGCGECGVSISVAHNSDASLSSFVELRPPVTAENASWERFHTRPITIEPATLGVNQGEISWELTGDGFFLLGDDGTTSVAGSTADPTTVLLHASMVGLAELRATHSMCPDKTQVVELHSGKQPPLSARLVNEQPWAERVRVFNQNEAIHTALHSGRHQDRSGLRYDAYIVEHKEPAAWVADPTLVDVTASGPNEARLAPGGTRFNRTLVSDDALPVSPMKVGDYDVVLDFNRNGFLDPGDLMMGPGNGPPGFVVMGDLSTPGPFDVLDFQFTGGVWFTQKVYYPSTIDSLPPPPLVVISHGNGHNYQWYDYLGEHLASHGYVVMSHTNMTQPGIETASATTLENTDFFFEALPSVEGGALEGRIDGSRIVWIGHSRGGEGVVRAYDRLVDEGYETDNYSAEDIVLISSIAPTTFYNVEYSNPHDVPYHLFAGAADGDVHGGPSSTNVQYFRFTSVAESAAQVTYLHGVGHNEFNCCGFDDATGPEQIGRDDTQEIAKAYYLALIRAYASGHRPSLDYFKRRADTFQPMQLPSATIVNEYRPEPWGYQVIDNFQSGPAIDVASSDATVSTTASAAVEDWLADGDGSLSASDADPMNGMTQSCCAGDENRGLVLQWDGDALIEWTFPEGGKDIRPFSWLSFRAAQTTRHALTNTLAQPLDFSVSLIDASGTMETIWFGQFGQITTPYQRSGQGSGSGWSNEFNTIRLRLSDFEDAAVDLDMSSIQSIQFNFGEAYGSPMGRIGIDDVLLEY